MKQIRSYEVKKTDERKKQDGTRNRKVGCNKHRKEEEKAEGQKQLLKEITKGNRKVKVTEAKEYKKRK